MWLWRQQRLLIGIHADKFNTAQAALHHAVDSVSAAAAADDLDVRYILQFFIEDKCHENSPKDNFVLYTKY